MNGSMDRHMLHRQIWGGSPIATLFVGLLLLWCVLVDAVMAQESRVALVIGNSSYTEIGQLKNPASDARLVAQRLRSIGFETHLHVDLDGAGMRRAVLRFADALAAKGKNSIGLVFYAGHGVQVRENNYLLPIDVKASREGELGLAAVHLADVLSAMFEAENKLNIVILDACRDNPLRKRMRAASLARIMHQA
jgi:uncharacterized caspase-like protein